MNNNNSNGDLFYKPFIKRSVGGVRSFDLSIDTFSIGPFINIEKHTHIIFINALFRDYVKEENIVIRVDEVPDSNELKIIINVEFTKPDSKEEKIELYENRLQWELLLKPKNSTINEPLKQFKVVDVVINYNETYLKNPELGEPIRGTRVILPK